MSARTHLPRLVERLAQIERRVGRVYATLAERNEFPVELRAVWQTLAEDEDSHRTVLELSAGLLNFMTSLPQISEVKLTKVEEEVTAVETAVQQPHLSVDEALGHALNLEGSELTNLITVWARAFSPSLSVLTRAVPDEKTHIRRLLEAVQTFSMNRDLHSQAAALWAHYEHEQAK